MTNSEINRLGEALRVGAVTTENLVALDDYRRSFQPAITQVVKDWQNYLGGTSVLVQRPSKSTPSIIAKLRRQATLKLSQIQDIAGLRVVLTDRYSQSVMSERVQSVFSNCKIIDRLSKPSFGYRAIHLVVTSLDRPVEVQLRTEMQHAWAHLSEQLADSLGHDLKYGGGNEAIKEQLAQLSDRIDSLEQNAHDWSKAQNQFNTFNRKTPFDEDMELVRDSMKALYQQHLSTSLKI
ncbi:MAG: hypothetical protein HC858_06660 [Brachymonas sp.]|nr:hypothetical protein [Brachymonas sp.]